MANATTVELLAEADVSAEADGTEQDIGTLRTAARCVAVLGEVSGGVPVVMLELSTRSSISAPWTSVKKRRCVGAAAHEFVVAGLQRYIRASWTPNGGQTVHLAILAEAHVLYCEPRDLPRFALPSQATQGVYADDLVEACIACSELADGYLNGSFALPLSSWSSDLRLQTGKLIAAEVLRVRGTDPEGPDQLVFDERDAAIKWFARIADGKLKPPGLIDTTPDDFEGGSVVESTPARGW